MITNFFRCGLVTVIVLLSATVHGADQVQVFPASGNYHGPIVVQAWTWPGHGTELRASAGADLHVLAEPFAGWVLLTGDTNLQFATVIAGEIGEVVSTSYRITPWVCTTTAPLADHEGITSTTPLEIRLTTATPGATIRYTIDGSLPTSDSAHANGAIRIAKSTTLTARAFGGYERIRIGPFTIKLPHIFPSGFLVEHYVIDSVPPPSIVAKPVLDPVGGVYSSAISVQATTGTFEAELHFTRDGSMPTLESETVSGPISVDRPQTLTVRGFRTGWTPSAVASADFSFLTAPCSSETTEGPHSGPITITVSCADPIAEIRYTLDGSEPTATSLLYKAPFELDGAAEMRARAIHQGWQPGPVLTRAFRFQVAQPALTPGGPHQFSTNLAVSASGVTPGATYHYRTDLGLPQNTDQEMPVTLTATTTLTIRGFRPGYEPSAVTEATYTLFPELRFVRRASSLSEGSTLPVVIELSAPAEKEINVVVALEDIAGEDVEIDHANLVIPVGAKQAEIMVSAIDDVLDETLEEFALRLVSTSWGTIPPETAAHIIRVADNDPAPAVHFEVARQTVAETAGEAHIRVRSTAVVGRPRVFTVLIDGGTARVGEDFEGISGEIVIPVGQDHADIVISLIDDDVPEAVEWLDLMLVDPIAGDVIAPARHRLTIISDERAHPALDGFALARSEIAHAALLPPQAARLFSILATAQRRALIASEGGSESGRIFAATLAVLGEQFPERRDLLREQVEALREDVSWSGLIDEPLYGPSVRAWTIGQEAFAEAATDGADRIWLGPQPSGAGIWYPSWANVAEPILPEWAHLRPLRISGTDAHRPPPPPALDSQEFADAVAEVRAISDERNSATLAIAASWADGPGSETPPGHWVAIADAWLRQADVSSEVEIDILDSMSSAMFDAGIATWDCKYHYWLIRPYQVDRSITTPIGQPNFPSYVSGHATFSGAAAEILATLIPASADSVTAAAEEAALSRLYGGIHYRFDNDAGLALGRAVAQSVLADHADGWAADLAPRIRIPQPSPGWRGNAMRPIASIEVIPGSSEIASENIRLIDARSGNDMPIDLDAVTDVTAPRTAHPAVDLEDGVYRWEVIAIDSEGHRTHGTRTFSIDHDGAPMVTIDAPTPGQIFPASSPVTVRGSINQPIVLATLNGSPVPVSDDGSLNIDLAIDTLAVQRLPLTLIGGRNEVCLRAIDRSGFSVERRFEILVDEVLPLVTIEYPTSGSVVVTDHVTVSGHVQDLVLGTIDTDNVVVNIGEIAVPVRNGSFRIDEVPLEYGENHLLVTATDAAGNVTTIDVVITRDAPRGMRVEVVSGSGQQSSIRTQVANPLRAVIKDNNAQIVAGALVSFAVSRGDGRLVDGDDAGGRTKTMLSDANGLVEASFILGSTAGFANQRVDVAVQGGDTPATFICDATSGPPFAVYASDGENQVGAAGQWLDRPLEVWVSDQAGNALIGMPVEFEITDGEGGLRTPGTVLDAASSLNVLTDGNGRARVEWKLGSTPGMASNGVRAWVGDDLHSAHFRASSVAVIAGLKTGGVSGLVLDQFRRPVPGVQLIVGGTLGGAISDSEGNFRITGLEPGHHHLNVLGILASNEDIRYPNLGFEIDIYAGAITPMGMPIYLPDMRLDNQQWVGGEDEVVLSLPGLPGAELVIAPNSTIRPDGIRGPVRMFTSPVDVQALPMPPPMGFNPGLAATLQPSGTRLDPPAVLRWPNLDGLPPGSQAPVLSFDHDLGRFVSVGMATVSNDGKSLVSDPGTGLTKAGWHFPVGTPVPTFTVTGLFPTLPPELVKPKSPPPPYEEPCAPVGISGPTTIREYESGIFTLDGGHGHTTWVVTAPEGSGAVAEFDEPTGATVVLRVFSVQPGKDLPAQANTLVLRAICGSAERTLTIKAIAADWTIDLDIDSDNNQGYALPLRSAKEEAKEGGTENPALGKLLVVNDAYTDVDAVPDFADGYRCDAFDHAEQNASAPFVPVIFALHPKLDPGEGDETLTIELSYDASDPNAVQVSEAGDDLQVFTLPAAGHLRLWARNGTEARNAARIQDGGDYIEPGVYSMAELGLVQNAQGSLVGTFYLEAVRAYDSDRHNRLITTIVNHISLDQPGIDTIEVTAVHLEGKDLTVTQGQVNTGNSLVTSDGVPDSLRSQFIQDWRVDISDNVILVDDPTGPTLNRLVKQSKGGRAYPKSGTLGILGGLLPQVDGLEDLDEVVLPYAVLVPQLQHVYPDGIPGSITLRAASVDLTILPSPNIATAPYGIDNLLGCRGIVTIHEGEHLLDLNRYRRRTATNDGAVKDFGTGSTPAQGTYQFLVTGRKTGETVFAIEASINGGWLPVIEIPVPVPVLAELQPRQHQLKTTQANTAMAKQAVLTGTTFTPASYMSIDEILESGDMSWEAPGATASMRTQEQIARSALVRAACILPWVNQQGTAAWIQPFFRAGGGARFAVTLEDELYGPTMDQLAQMMSFGNSLGYDSILAELDSQGGPPLGLWDRWYYQWTGPDTRTAGTTTDPDVLAELNRLEFRAKELLETAAKARFCQFFSLDMEPAVFVETANWIAATKDLSEYAGDPEELATQLSSQLNDSEKAVMPDTYQWQPMVKTRLPDWLTSVRAGMGFTSTIRQFLNTPVTPNMSLGHPWIEDLTEYMIQERVEVVKALITELLKRVPSTNSPEWPLRMTYQYSSDAEKAVFTDILMPSSNPLYDLPLVIHDDAQMTLTLPDAAKGIAMAPYQYRSTYSILANRWSGYSSVRDVQFLLLNTENDQPGTIGFGMGKFLYYRISANGQSRSQAQNSTDVLGWMILMAMDEIHVLQTLTGERQTAQFWENAMRESKWGVISAIAFQSGDFLYGLGGMTNAWLGYDLISGEKIEGWERAGLVGLAVLDVVDPFAIIGAGKKLAKGSLAYARGLRKAAAETMPTSALKKVTTELVQGADTAAVDTLETTRRATDAAGNPIKVETPNARHAAGKVYTEAVPAAQVSDEMRHAVEATIAPQTPHTAASTGTRPREADVGPVPEVNKPHALKSVRSQEPLTGKAVEDIKKFERLKPIEREILALSGPDALLEFQKRACFVAGTQVLTIKGWRSIENVCSGDWVAARNETDSQARVAWKQVTATHQRNVVATRIMVLRTCRSGLGQQLSAGDDDLIYRIETTDEHPFWSLLTNGWTSAIDLDKGEIIRGLNTNWVVVESDGQEFKNTVYNLTVSDAHTYFVGERGRGEGFESFGIWVHNTCRAEELAAKFGGVGSPELKESIARAVGKNVEDLDGFDYSKALDMYNQSIKDGVPGLPGSIKRKVKSSPGGERVSALSYEMDRALGKQRRSILRNGQDHHLIPDELADKRSGDVLKTIGFEMDHYTNGMRLPDQILPDVDKTVHFGGHDAYTNALDQVLMSRFEEIGTKYGNDYAKWGPDAINDARRAVREVRVRARLALRSGSPPLAATRAGDDIDVPALTLWWADVLEGGIP